MQVLFGSAADTVLGARTAPAPTVTDRGSGWAGYKGVMMLGGTYANSFESSSVYGFGASFGYSRNFMGFILDQSFGLFLAGFSLLDVLANASGPLSARVISQRLLVAPQTLIALLGRLQVHLYAESDTPNPDASAQPA